LPTRNYLLTELNDEKKIRIRRVVWRLVKEEPLGAYVLRQADAVQSIYGYNNPALGIEFIKPGGGASAKCGRSRYG
jgi:hypothetical protein